MALKTSNIKPKNNLGFTIVELLVVIVVIGILAAITIVSYSGITSKATATTLQSDLSNSAKKLKMYYTEHGNYPATLVSVDSNVTYCPTAPTDTTYCVKPTNGNIVEYTVNGTQGFKLVIKKGTLSYSITEDSTPSLSILLPESDWITIGTQRWARKNLNVGTMIAATTRQTNNGGVNIVERYCYNNLESNCTLDDNGGLYEWSEAMNYSTTEGVQGICPAGSHIPSDNDWKILEMQLGMTQDQVDIKDDWRGTDQGAQLIPSGSSNLRIPYAGDNVLTMFHYRGSQAYLWSSTESTEYANSAISRLLRSGYNTVYRAEWSTNGGLGFSVRCLGD